MLLWEEAQVNKLSAVCSKHFLSTDYCRGPNRVLFVHVVPSLNLDQTAPKPQKKVEPTEGSSERQPVVKEPSKNGCLKSQSQCKLYTKIKQERRGLRTVIPKKKAVDPLKKILMSEQGNSTWKRNTIIANQR